MNDKNISKPNQSFSLEGRLQHSAALGALQMSGVHPGLEAQLSERLRTFDFISDGAQEPRVPITMRTTFEPDMADEARTAITDSLELQRTDPTVRFEDKVAADALLALIRNPDPLSK